MPARSRPIPEESALERQGSDATEECTWRTMAEAAAAAAAAMEDPVMVVRQDWSLTALDVQHLPAKG